MIAQFIAAFDDIVIGRYNRQRVEKDQIAVRYLYAPKQRIMHDIVNENKTITLPAVAVSVAGVSRDESRVFNKLDGFYYSGTDASNELYSKHIKAPIPVNLNLSVSILSRYQSDIDQILSNFVPFCNPYVVISWPVPKKFGLAVDQEIRSEVLWDGNVNLSYPTELAGTDKARVTADTSFTIKGWLFKDTDDPAGNIYFIRQNFIAEDYITEYETLTATASAAPTETVELSGTPFVTDLYYNNVLLRGPMQFEALANQDDPVITMKGVGLSNTSGVLLSTVNEANFLKADLKPNLVIRGFTEFGDTAFSRQPGISGIRLEHQVLNDTTISFTLPLTTMAEVGKMTFIPFNTAGHDTSINSVLSADAPDVNAAVQNNYRGIEPTYIELLNGAFVQLNYGEGADTDGVLSVEEDRFWQNSLNPYFFIDNN